MLLLVALQVPPFSTTQILINRRNHLHLLRAKFNYTTTPSLSLLSPSPFCISPLQFIYTTIFQVTAIGTHNHGLVICADDEKQEEEMEMRCLSVDLCLTRELGPCLSIKEGYAKLKQAIRREKLLTSSSTFPFTSGVIHYRVLVPPSAKALDWLFSQHIHFPIYPHFYFSSDQPNNFRRLSSVGHAICIHGSCDKHKGYRLLSRYLSPDALTQAYGFTGLNLCKDISSQGQDRKSFYLFIPQIELRELEGCSVLAATLIWDDSLSLSFESAVYFLESCLDQMGHEIIPTNIYERERWMSYNCAKENVLEGDISHLVCLDGVVLAGIDNTSDKCMQKKELLTCDESYVCISPTCAFTFNMLHYLNQSEFSIKECSNINMVWASLIVEELVRLGINVISLSL